MTIPESAIPPQGDPTAAAGPTVSVGTYPDYASAQRAVDHLSDNKFPVERVAIVGTDLRIVENVLGRLTVGRAALAGFASGAWFGLFIGVVLTFFSPTINWGFFLAAILIGAAFGMLFRLVSYGISRRSRDFESVNQVLASNYQVLVDPELVDQARDALAKPKAD